ncbi:hypothetical protein CYLTODRAFT_375411 [Cylindrobasidium torrendii FP15055 ss-10]|uniref:Pinin/SDK/MemA protein domain-containing protein n=1 Tax=Cylindrobasidium torrendii FP15055 ss-10 TaxID=1314674 RepID=A0A0D7BDW0_9AGAR|nr:hypothetical protein CYLTODRAFT_375411 [Cylindrobasidium torrendii FP15055 ss-10]
MSEPPADTAVTPSEEPKRAPRPRLGGKMFGLVVGTLQKASREDKLLRASEAAKKRQLLESRLATKLQSETAVVRKKEDARKSKTTALRLEETLGYKDSVAKFRRRRVPQLAGFLCTAGDDLDVRRTHPPPVYFLPKVLLPEQEEILARRRELAAEKSRRDWDSFKTQKEEGIAEIRDLRAKVAEETEDAKDTSMDVDDDAKEKKDDDAMMDADPVPPAHTEIPDAKPERAPSPPPLAPKLIPQAPSTPERNDEPMQADEDEVEY